MIQTRTIGSHTEIYSDKNGGGKSETYITQSKTTVFHDFFTRKILGEGETIEDFMEVSQAERDRLQGIRDAWVRPPQVFIDQWNTACGIWGRYNEQTGYFELNGLTDITYEEALRIYDVGAITTYDCAGFYNVRNNGFIRTNLPRKIDSQWGYNSQGFNAHNFLANKGMEVLNLEPFWGEDPNGFMVDSRLNGHGITSNFYNFADNEWENRANLRKIIGVVDLRLMRHSQQFNALTFCTKLVDVKIRNCGCYMRLTNAAKLSLESVSYLVENAIATTEGIPIYIYRDVYAKLTGDTTNEEVAAMDPEELQKWMEIVPLAAEKNITFVSSN